MSLGMVQSLMRSRASSGAASYVAHRGGGVSPTTDNVALYALYFFNTLMVYCVQQCLKAPYWIQRRLTSPPFTWQAYRVLVVITPVIMTETISWIYPNPVGGFSLLIIKLFVGNALSLIADLFYLLMLFPSDEHFGVGRPPLSYSEFEVGGVSYSAYLLGDVLIVDPTGRYREHRISKDSIDIETTQLVRALWDLIAKTCNLGDKKLDWIRKGYIWIWLGNDWEKISLNVNLSDEDKRRYNELTGRSIHIPVECVHVYKDILDLIQNNLEGKTHPIVEHMRRQRGANNQEIEIVEAANAQILEDIEGVHGTLETNQQVQRQIRKSLNELEPKLFGQQQQVDRTLKMLEKKVEEMRRDLRVKEKKREEIETHLRRENSAIANLYQEVERLRKEKRSDKNEITALMHKLKELERAKSSLKSGGSRKAMGQPQGGKQDQRIPNLMGKIKEMNRNLFEKNEEIARLERSLKDLLEKDAIYKEEGKLIEFQKRQIRELQEDIKDLRDENARLEKNG